MVDSWNMDGDGVPGYLKGFNLIEGNENFAASENAQFIKMVLDLKGIDQKGLRLRFVYPESDPKQITRDEDWWFQRPRTYETGEIRIWRIDGNEERNPNGVENEGDFVTSNQSYSPEELGFDAETKEVTFFVEAVWESSAVADVLVDIQYSKKEAPQSESDWTSGDKIRITTTRAELWGKDYNESEFEVWDTLATTDLELGPADVTVTLEGETAEDPSLTLNNPFSPGSFRIFKMKIYDPRETLDVLTVGGQEVSLNQTGNTWESDEFVILEPGAPQGMTVDATVVETSDTTVELEYNPIFGGRKTPKVVKPSELDQTLATLADEVTEGMKNENWTPTNPDDHGAFGKEAHSRFSEKLNRKKGWVADFYVEQRDDGKWYRVASTGDDVTQVDAAFFKDGYKPKVGDAIDRTKLVDVYDLKTGLKGGFSTQTTQSARLTDFNNGRPVKIVRSKWYCSRFGKWQLRRVAKVAMFCLSFLGAAKSAHALVYHNQYDAELAEIHQLAREIRQDGDGDPFNWTHINDVILVQKIIAYLQHFTPNVGEENLVQVALIYRALARDHEAFIDPTLDEEEDEDE
jgi:hypothetical protein